MRVDVVEESRFWHQAKRHREATAKRLDETPPVFWLPERFHMRDLPAFSARPLQRRPDGFLFNRDWLSGPCYCERCHVSCAEVLKFTTFAF